MYPAMLYRDGVLSGDANNQRIVHSESDELVAMSEGFERWTTKAEPSAAVPAAADSSLAADVAFTNAAKPEGSKEPAAQVAGRKGKK